MHPSDSMEPSPTVFWTDFKRGSLISTGWGVSPNDTTSAALDLCYTHYDLRPHKARVTLALPTDCGITVTKVFHTSQCRYISPEATMHPSPATFDLLIVIPQTGPAITIVWTLDIASLGS